MIEKSFFGGTTPSGFQAQLAQAVSGTEYYTYILKGGSGTGKSSIMKKVGERFAEREHVTCFYCSLDPESLDAVMMHASKVILVDGTPPHVFEPQFPGVCQEIVDLGQCWDKAILRSNREKIVKASELSKSMSASAAYYNKALGLICDDTYICAKGFVDRRKIEVAARNFCDRLFENSERRTRSGEQTVRQLSVMTSRGYVTLLDAAESCRRFYLLEDKLFAASSLFIDIAAAQAMERGYDTELSPCLLCERPISEHLLIDELGTVLMTSNPLTRIADEKAERIDCSMFYDVERMRPYERHFASNRSLIDALAGSSREMLEDAKRLHDETEQYYISAMDFNAIDSVCERICEEIERRAQAII